MEQLELRKILNLVGELKDSEKENSASSRFRENFIEEIEGINTIKNYVQECLENKGIQYARALQDLVNHVGTLLGFRVKYGRYSGKSNKIGYDGLWKSPTGKKFIVETKSSNDFAIRTGQILGYKNELISEKNYKKNNMLGIFVLGSKDEKSEQLKNAIIGEERDKELRIIHIRPLLNLLEIKQRYNVTHQSILSILLPSGPQIDPYVELMSNLLTQESQENIDEKEFKQDSEMAEKPGAEIDKKKEIDDYTGLKPQAFLFKEKKVEVKKWKEIIIKLSEEIKDQHPEEFDKVLEIKGRKRNYFSYDKDDLHNPSKTDINNTDIYCETNLSANQIVNICKKIIQKFGYNKDSFQVEVKEK